MSKKLVDHFGLGEEETVLATYSCSLIVTTSSLSSSTPSLPSFFLSFSSSLATPAHTRRSGWIILFHKAAAFAAHPWNILLPFKDIIAIYADSLHSKHRKRGDQPGRSGSEKHNGIRIVLSDRRTFLFVDFAKREEAYSLLSLLWESDMESRIHLSDARPQSSLTSLVSFSAEEFEKKDGMQESYSF